MGKFWENFGKNLGDRGCSFLKGVGGLAGSASVLALAKDKKYPLAFKPEDILRKVKKFKLALP